MSESSLLAVTVAAGVLAPGPHVIRPAPRRTPAAAAADAAASRKDASVRKVFQAELHQVGEELIQAISKAPAPEYLLVEPDGSIYGVLVTSDVDAAFRAGA